MTEVASSQVSGRLSTETRPALTASQIASGSGGAATSE